jgi:hypothetical protein
MDPGIMSQIARPAHRTGDFEAAKHRDNAPAPDFPAARRNLRQASATYQKKSRRVPKSQIHSRKQLKAGLTNSALKGTNVAAYGRQ